MDKQDALIKNLSSQIESTIVGMDVVSPAVIVQLPVTKSAEDIKKR